MAVYTDIHEQDLSAFLRQYNIGSLLSYRGIAEGVENSNFMLHTTQGPFILTLYEKRVSKEDLPFFLQLMQHLQAKNISCPQPVVQKNGKMLGTLAGRPAAIITFLEGTWMRTPHVQHCREVGKGLAQLHLAGSDFSMTRKNSLSMQTWRPLWDSFQHEADVFGADIVDKIDEELSALEKQWPQELPHGIIHADLFNDNVFFLGHTLSGIIDFYSACHDFFAYDIAICLNAWCFERDGTYNITKAHGMLKQYQMVRSLHKSEMALLPVLARGAAMRFFLTRAYDWIHTPQDSFVVKKDPMEYFSKLQFFQKIQSPFELGLS